MADISPVTGEQYYSGDWQDIQEVLRVLNIGEGKMARVTQTMVNHYQEMIDRDMDALLQDTYQVPIRAYNMIQATSGVVPATAGGSVSGNITLGIGSLVGTLSGANWAFIPTSVIVSVSMPSGGNNIFATVDASTISADGFTVHVSSAPSVSGYLLSYLATAVAVVGSPYVGAGAQIRVFPGDVRRAARYWTAGQLLVNEFQQLEANLTEQATQMVSDARMQVYEMSRPTHRIPGQRRKSNISRTMPPGWQPSAFSERPS